MAYVPKACGFVIARRADDGWAYLLLTSRKWSEPGFPKGHVDEGETELETARRETEEEAGLTDLEALPGFRREISYPVVRKGRSYEKTSVYFLAKVQTPEMRLSSEHTEAGWYDFGEAHARLGFEDARAVLREAALYLKDPALFDREPKSEAEADIFLRALPGATDLLVAHLRGAARLARAFASSLERAGHACHVEAAAVGTLLHDTGRALGRHDDHQRAGRRYLLDTPYAPYAFACISHSTKGASRDALLATELPADEVDDYFSLIDSTTFTWEEHCAALADSCMKHDQAVHPDIRFADLRKRYGASRLVDLQERRTTAIRETFREATGEDPLALVDLA